MIQEEMQVGLDRVLVAAAFIAAVSLAVAGWLGSLDVLSYVGLIAFMLAFTLAAVSENARINRRTQALLRIIRAEAELQAGPGLRDARSL